MSDAPKSKIDQVVDLIDNYLYCCDGYPEDYDYSLRDEDDFEDFRSELESLIKS